MSMIIGYIGPMIGALVFVQLAWALGFTGYAVAISGALGAVAGGLAWWYSPLPWTNGGFGEPAVKPRQWGFTNEPQEGYADDPESRWRVRFLPLPVTVAEKKEDEGDDG